MYLQVPASQLNSLGFRRFNSDYYFPAYNQTDHIHIGTSTGYYDKDTWISASPGNVFVMFISLKTNNQHWFSFRHNPQTGYFSFPAGYNYGVMDAGHSGDSWSDVLIELEIIR